MLEKPNLDEARIIACLREEYSLQAARVDFLPLGADQNTAVYRVVAGDGTARFLKLRSGRFDETSVRLAVFLGSQGLRQVIPPLPARNGLPWGNLEAYRSILYPFVEGRDGYQLALSDGQLEELGEFLHRLHATRLPAELLVHIRREDYSPMYRAGLKAWLERIETGCWEEPVAREAAALLKDRREVILDLLQRAEGSLQAFRAAAPEFVLCHSDLHAGNLLIDARGSLFIVDWDDPILAPRERDLMYISGGQLGGWRSPAAETAPFYRGYGPGPVDSHGLAYYRYERIITDLALFCEQLLSSESGGKDRGQALEYLASNFLPGNTLEIALQADIPARLA